MKVTRLLDRRAGFGLASLGLLLSMVAPAAIPAFASAAQLSTRSITMSTSATSATGASYQVNFTGTGNISATASSEGGVIIDFCSNTAVLGDTCTAPTGLDLTGATVNGVEYNSVAAGSNGTVNAASGGHIEWEAGSAYTGGDTFEFTINGVANPTTVGVFYARITTYSNQTNLQDYNSATDVGDYSDEGSIALAATSGIGITSYVLEAMSFCVSRGDVGESTDLDAVGGQVAPSENCGAGEAGDCDPVEVDADAADDGCVVPPTMTLGTDDGSGNIVLASDTLATGRVWAQLSSNASGNAVVNLKSDAVDCGGLYRNGTSDAGHCNIAPKNSGGSFTAGTANFGLTVGSSVGALKANGDPTSGSGTIDTDASYSPTDYFVDFASGNGTGVTSTYGSALFETDGAVDNLNVPVTFGASISNNTPAGTYGATFSLIAVGTF